MFARPGHPWPIGAFCPREVDEWGQIWICCPRCICGACGKTWTLSAHVPKSIPGLCPKCKAPVETIQESEAA